MEKDLRLGMVDGLRPDVAHGLPQVFQEWKWILGGFLLYEVLSWQFELSPVDEFGGGCADVLLEGIAKSQHHHRQNFGPVGCLVAFNSGFERTVPSFYRAVGLRMISGGTVSLASDQIDESVEYL